MTERYENSQDTENGAGDTPFLPPDFHLRSTSELAVFRRASLTPIVIPSY